MKISRTIFEIFSIQQKPSDDHFAPPFPRPNKVNFIKDNGKGELEYRNLFGCNNNSDITLLKAIFHQAEFSARSDIFFCLKTNLAESGRQREKKYHSARKIPPSGKRPLCLTLQWEDGT